MLRTTSIPVGLFLISVLFPGVTAASATPPAEGPGIVTPGKSSEADRPQRAGVSSEEWLAALSHVSVGRSQQDSITPRVRSYRHQAAVWKEEVDPTYRKMLKEYRNADPENRVRLLLEINAIRKTRPNFLQLKESILQSLDAAQKSDLLEQVKQEKLRVDNRLGRAKDSKRAGGRPERDAVEDSGPKQETDTRQAWRFVDDLEPERHVDPAAVSATKAKAASPPEAK